MVYNHRKVRLIESNAKCRHLKKFTFEGTWRQVFFLSEALYPPRFCLGWSSNFVGSESGQIQSVKTPAEDGLQHIATPLPTPLPATHCLYKLYFDMHWEGGKVNQREG
jgi:hypothetical protein